jgi:hypothetical protein
MPRMTLRIFSLPIRVNNVDITQRTGLCQRC